MFGNCSKGNLNDWTDSEGNKITYFYFGESEYERKLQGARKVMYMSLHDGRLYAEKVDPSHKRRICCIQEIIGKFQYYRAKLLKMNLRKWTKKVKVYDIYDTSESYDNISYNYNKSI